MNYFNKNINVRYWNVPCYVLNVDHKKLLSPVFSAYNEKKKALEVVERAHFTWFITEICGVLTLTGLMIYKQQV